MLYLQAKTDSSVHKGKFLYKEKLSSNRNKLFFSYPLFMNAINNEQGIIIENNFNDSDFLIEENIEINTLINFKYSLKKPITVKIKRERFEYIGDIPELEIYSFGKDKFEVLREINEEITDLFEDLVEMSDNKLGKYPKKWKRILREYIQKNED